MSNFEKIKKMSVEELAESFILDCNCCIYFEPCIEACDCDYDCKDGIKEWLESEVE